MTTIGIICELNPLHSGHLRLLDFARARADAVVLALSGPFVQRGEVAVMDPWTRARQAVRHGVDLVLQMPTAYVLQSADFFAQGGVMTLAALGVDGLAFGVEETARPVSASTLDHTLLQRHLNAGLSYRRAMESALDLRLFPNAMLAGQYQKSVRERHLPWTFHPLERPISDASPSATRLRATLATLAPNAERRTPPDALVSDTEWRAQLDAPAFDDLVDKDLVAREYLPADTDPVVDWLQLEFRRGTLDLTTSPHFESGMEHRVTAVLDAFSHEKGPHTLEDLVTRCANKRQSKARYRRMIWTSLLGITKADLVPVTYLMPLAFNPKGATLLKRAPYPVIQKNLPKNISADAKRLLAVDHKAWTIAQHLTGQMRSRESYRYMVD